MLIKHIYMYIYIYFKLKFENVVTVGWIRNYDRVGAKNKVRA